MKCFKLEENDAGSFEMMKVGFGEQTMGSGATTVEDAKRSRHPLMSKTKRMWTE